MKKESKLKFMPSVTSIINEAKNNLDIHENFLNFLINKELDELRSKIINDNYNFDKEEIIKKISKKIIKNSKVKLTLINNNLDLIKYVKQNIYGNKIVIGMGAGSISNWIRDLPNLI